MNRSIWKRILVLMLALSMILPTIGSILPEVDAYPSGIFNVGSVTGPTSGEAGWLPDGVYVIKMKGNTNLCWTLDTSKRVTDPDNGDYGKRAQVKLDAVDTVDYTNQMFVVQRVFNEDVTDDGLESYYRIRAVGSDRYLNKSGTSMLHEWPSSLSASDENKFKIYMIGSKDGYRIRYSDDTKLQAGSGTDAYASGDYLQFVSGNNNAGIFVFQPVQVDLGGSQFTVQSVANTSAALKTRGTGKQLVTYANYGVSDQRFTFTKTTDGYYNIQDNAGNYLRAADLHSSDTATATKQAHTRVRTSSGNGTDNEEKWLAIPSLPNVNATTGEVTYNYSFVNYATGGYLYTCGNLTNIENYNGVCTRISDLGDRVVWKLKLVETLTVGDRLNADTGVFRNTRNVYDTIRLPIKIYDYLNDGMLFECSSSVGNASVYGYHGGANMPVVSSYARDFTFGCKYANPHQGTYVETMNGLNAKLDVQIVTEANTDSTVKGLGSKLSYATYSAYTSDNGGFVQISGFGTAEKEKVRYVTVVYDPSGTDFTDGVQLQYTANGVTYTTSTQTFSGLQENWWRYAVLDIKAGISDADWNSMTTIGDIYMTFPTKIDDSASGFVRIAYIEFSERKEEAVAFGDAANAFCRNPGKFGIWQMGNNGAFGMLRGSSGGSWSAYTGNYYSYNAPNDGSNVYQTGYIGASSSNITMTGINADGTIQWGYAKDTVPMGIYYYPEGDTSPFLLGEGSEQYTLYSQVTSGASTIGLVKSKLAVDSDGTRRLDYSRGAVAYIAHHLQASLQIPESNGNTFYYNFVEGTKSDRYGGKDLASALRTILSAKSYTLGNWYDTLSRESKLIGTWEVCSGNIQTCYDAAYFLLNNLFVANSYNEVQTKFNYLELINFTLSDGSGKEAYVFDAAFTNSLNAKEAVSSVVYDTTNKVIRNNNAWSKTHVIYGTNAGTNLYPFLPVWETYDMSTHTGTQNATVTPYIFDDSAVNIGPYDATYVNHNYNYVLQSNGQFVYHADDDLFFEFEGDDDVYLFINGELVLDIGGAHSITKVKMNLNDYVTAAHAAVASGSTKARDTALALEEGQSYSFDFYYMERHGTGANMRIVTNIRVTDGTIQNEKLAYQNDTQINYGGIIDKDSPVEYGFAIKNLGNAFMDKVMFADDTIGINIDYLNGLTIKEGYENRVCDAKGGTLDVTDLLATVTGYDANGKQVSYTEVVFKTNEELKQFLYNCTAPSENQTGLILTNDAGFWQYTRLEIRGFAYKLTEDDISAKVFDNEVLTTAYFGSDPTYGSAEMRVYVPTGTQYYQWSGHQLNVSLNELYADIIEADSNLSGATISSAYVSTSNGTANPGNTAVKIANGKLSINYTTPGAYQFYVAITYIQDGKTYTNAPVPVRAIVTDVVDSVYILDYGLRVDLAQDHELTKGDFITIPGKTLGHVLEGVCAETNAPSYGNNVISFTKDSDGKLTGTNGEFQLVSSTHRFVYKPTDFMDSADTIYVAYRVHEGTATSGNIGTIDINKEVEMYKKVTILPANVVYYEDDFAGIEYVGADDDDTTADNVIEIIKGQNADGSDILGDSTDKNTLTPEQSADQNMNYGYDPVYEDLNNNTSTGHISMSGKTVKKITIQKKGDIASFDFKGTGFELVSRTTANASGTIAISVKDSAGNEIRYIPVITEFDNTADGTNDTDTEAIYQVPVVRVEGLTHGQYMVTIVGYPAYEWTQNPDGTWSKDMKESYLYIDGVRIYNPLGNGSGTDKYLDTEKDAKFVNVRKLIAESYLAQVIMSFASADDSTGTLTLSTGTYTFVENRNNDEYTQNVAGSINDYLLAGPNTEVYVDSASKDTALVLYVKPDATNDTPVLQVGIRALDHSKFYGVACAADCDCTDLKAYYGTGNSAESLSWTQIGDQVIMSGTEQYYTINFAKCPQTNDGWYQVVIRVDNGMASFTNIKYKGLTIQQNKVSSDAATLKYIDGKLVKYDADGNVIEDGVEAASYMTFSLIRRQMATPLSNVTVNPDGTEDPDDVVNPDDTEDPDDVVNPDDTEDPEDVVDPDDTENPEDVVNPDDTEDPEDVVDPDDTEDPEDVVDPDDTEDPGNVVDPDDTTNPDDEVSPETGDTSIAHWIALAMVSMVAVLTRTVRSEKKRNAM